MNDLTRPIIGIENRTAQEVFDIMCDRLRAASITPPAPERSKEEVTIDRIEAILDHPSSSPEHDLAAIRQALAHLALEPASLHKGEVEPVFISRAFDPMTAGSFKPVASPAPLPVTVTDGWRSIETAPKDASEILLRIPATARGQARVMVGHWACDMSGEEQPPFRGWFYATGYGFAGIEPSPSHWAPLTLTAALSKPGDQ